MDIAIFKSIADLWKNAISIAAQHRKANTEDFEQTFKPLFDQMHTVVAEYYDIV
jgi:hypothetical protein